jgi:ribonuclease P protein component
MHKAVERNANKRLVREVFRAHAIKCQKLDLVVLIRQTSAQTFENQRVELSNLFNRLEARCA